MCHISRSFTFLKCNRINQLTACLNRLRQAIGFFRVHPVIVWHIILPCRSIYTYRYQPVSFSDRKCISKRIPHYCRFIRKIISSKVFSPPHIKAGFTLTIGPSFVHFVNIEIYIRNVLHTTNIISIISIINRQGSTGLQVTLSRNGNRYSLNSLYRFILLAA